MNEWKLIKYFFSHKFFMAIIQFLVTMIVTLFFDLTVAIIVGIAVSMILFVVKSGLTVSTSDIKDDEGNIRDHAKIVYVEGPLFFGTQEKLFNELSIPPEKRNEIIVIADNNGLALVEGIGCDKRFSVTKETKRILCIGIERN